MTRASARKVPSAKEIEEPPWDDCKIAFSLDNDSPFDDERHFLEASEPGGCGLPSNWSLDEVDGTGARWVAVFRIQGLPTVADGQAVITWLKKIGARA